MPVSDKRFTDVVHAGTVPDEKTGAIMTPIYQTSTYVQQAPGEHKGWDYSRAGNPTRDALEEAFATLEGAAHGLAFSSGLAAEQAIVQLLDPGSRVWVCDDVYGGTGRLFRKVFSKYNIDFQFFDMTDDAAMDERLAAGPPPHMIWVETPTNPLLKIIDIGAMAGRAQKCGAILVVDNTFASPLFQSPLQLGADVVVHSTTKYIGGHSDIIGGAVMTSDADLHERIKFVQFAAGAVPGPLECFMLLRSIKSLAVRMERHESNALAVARFLHDHPRVQEVYYPGLESHPGHTLAKKQMQGWSGMVSFNLDGDFSGVKKFVKALRIFELAESLGGVESLINHPELMTHASVPEPLRRQLGIGANLLRLSVGIESATDLIADLDQALK